MRTPGDDFSAYKKRQMLVKKTAASIVFAFVLLTVAVFTGFTPLKQVEVVNNKRYTAESIVKVSGLEAGKNTMSYKLKKAEQNIKTQLPYIQTVEIKRSVGKVTVTVTETTAKYALEQDKKYILLDSQMKVLESGVSNIPDSAVKVLGLDPTGVAVGYNIEVGNKSGVNLLPTISKLINDLKVENITQIDLSDLNNISLMYQNRLQLILGREEDLEYNLRFAKETIKRENAIDPRQHGSFDFSKLGKAVFKPYIVTTLPEPKHTLPVTTVPTTVKVSAAAATSAVSSTATTAVTRPAQ